MENGTIKVFSRIGFSLIVCLVLFNFIAFCLGPVYSASCNSEINDSFQTLDKWNVSVTGGESSFWRGYTNSQVWGQTMPLAIDSASEYYEGLVLKGVLVKDDKVYAYECSSGEGCQAVYLKNLSEFWNFQNVNSGWTVPLPIDKVDAFSQFYQGSVLKNYVYRGNRIWYYQCTGGNCQPVYTKTLSEQWSGNLAASNWAYPPPSDTVDAVSQYYSGSVLKTYVFSGNKLHHYRCENGCQTGYVKDLTKGNSVVIALKDGEQSILTEGMNEQGKISLTYDLCQAVHGRVGIDFYDDGFSEKKIVFSVNEKKFSDLQFELGDFSGVGIYFDIYSNEYSYQVHNRFSRANSTLPTGILRSKGWHSLEFVSSPVGVFGLIDGINLTWLDGKKSNEGFTYNINLNSGFKNDGFSSISLRSDGFGDGYFANLRFSNIDTLNINLSSNSDLQLLSEKIADYYFNQYPFSGEIDFYSTLPPANVVGTNDLIQMNNMILLLLNRIKLNGDFSLYDKIFPLFDYLSNNYQLWKHKSGATPMVAAGYTLSTRRIWNRLDESRKNLAISNILEEARYWRDVDLLINTVPWGTIRSRLPFQRQISATDVSLMNAASRDNAWTSAFFNLVATWEETKNRYPADAEDFKILAKILAYHSLTRNGDVAYGVHPNEARLGNNALISVSPTLLDNYNNPTVWSNPNPAYTFVTIQQINRGLLPAYLLGEINNVDQAMFHNFAPVISNVEKNVDWETFRYRSGVEDPTHIFYVPNKVLDGSTCDKFACNTSFDLFGKGHQHEDFAINVSTLAELAMIPDGKTGVNQSVYKSRLADLLKYEFYTLQGNPRMPWYPSGQQNGQKITNQEASLTNKYPFVVGQIEAFDPLLGIGYPVHPRIVIMMNANVAVEHLYAAMFLNPDDYDLDCAPSDVDCSGEVESFDLSRIVVKFGDDAFLGTAEDIDRSLKINSLDLSILMGNYGK